jgi:hypothetical protein
MNHAVLCLSVRPDHGDIVKRGTISIEPGRGRLEMFPLPTDRGTLESVIRYLFGRWWISIRFGPLLAGAVYEGRADAKPTIHRVDGFLKVDIGRWYFHVCVGPSRRADDPEGERARCPSRAEIYRLLDGDRPVSWGFRMYNGEGQQVMSVTLPNPYLDDELERVREPDWSRLACWDHLRRRHLGLGPDPCDRGQRSQCKSADE